MFKPRNLFVGLALLLALSNSSVATEQAKGQAQEKLATVTLKINEAELSTEIANTGDQRYMGLSFRETLPDNSAMLFVYPGEQMLTFTMRNTLIPLSIAYISKSLVIQEIHDMPVGPDQLFPSEKPAKFALEVNQGWFERNNITVGTQILMRK